MADIRESIEGAVQYLSEHPEEARYTDSSNPGPNARWTCNADPMIRLVRSL